MKSMQKTNWGLFDPLQYIEDNYSYPHHEDCQIMDHLAKYYQSLPILNKAIEVGVGPNLYPLMLMLPKAKLIKAIDPNPRSISYLRQQLSSPDLNWQQFWQYLTKQNSKLTHVDWLKELNSKIDLNLGDIEAHKPNIYDLGSAFFVLESITDSIIKFKELCYQFIQTIKPGGHAVAVFMENSQGYSISGIQFPAVSINKSILKSIFSPLLTNLQITHIDPDIKPLRPGYSGMLILTGEKKRGA